MLDHHFYNFVFWLGVPAVIGILILIYKKIQNVNTAKRSSNLNKKALEGKLTEENLPEMDSIQFTIPEEKIIANINNLILGLCAGDELLEEGKKPLKIGFVQRLSATKTVLGIEMDSEEILAASSDTNTLYTVKNLLYLSIEHDLQQHAYLIKSTLYKDNSDKSLLRDASHALYLTITK